MIPDVAAKRGGEAKRDARSAHQRRAGDKLDALRSGPMRVRPLMKAFARKALESLFV